MGWITDLLKDVPLSAVLREKLATLEAEHQRLEEHSRALQADLSKAHRENQQLRDTLARQNAREAELPEPQLKVLLFVAEHPGYNHYGIAYDCGIGEELATFYLEELQTAELAERRGLAPHRWEWHPTQEGRRYLLQRGLLR